MRVFLALLFSLPVFHLNAAAVVEASGELPADARDEHGDTIGGIGSGIVYDAKDEVFFCVSDRGPGDGSLPWRPRYLVLKITQEGDRLVPKVLKSVLFRDESGRAMTGLMPDDAEAGTPRMKDGRTCIDPEAIALAPDGSIYVTDEYGPYLYQFARDGRMIRRLELPETFQPRTREGRLDFTDKADLVSGRDVNRGPEGMCLLPDGKTAVLAFQSALVQDGGKAAGEALLLFLNLQTGKPSAIFRHAMSPAEAGSQAEKLLVNDLAALDDHRFLLLERDELGRNGDKDPTTARYKSVWLIDTRTATNLLQADKTTSRRSVSKHLLFNLPDLVPDPKTLGAKWEGLALLPSPSAAEAVLLMTADNDFLTPVIHDEGKENSFPRVEDSVPMQFFKIRAALPENP